MLYTYTNSSQTVVTGGTVVLNNNGVLCGCSATHSTNTNSISLNKPGIYQVTFNSDAVESGTAGNITVQLYGNGAIVPGAESTTFSGTATSVVNPSFTALVKVNCNCCANTTNVPYVLTFVNTGVGATYTNAAVTVVKVK